MKVFLSSFKRLPIGKIGGSLCNELPEELGSFLLKKQLRDNIHFEHYIDEIIMGNVVAGGGNVARKVGLLSNLEPIIPAFTVDRQCSSGLDSVLLARTKILSRDSDLIVCGGIESTSLAPWQIKKPSNLYGSPPEFLSRQTLSAGKYEDPDMGIACEALARKYSISRHEQDRFALRSQMNYKRSLEGHVFEDEIIPYGSFEADQSPRLDTTLSDLSKLPPAFLEKGTITAGNCCSLNDGASLGFVFSEHFALSHQLSPEFELVGGVAIGVTPEKFGIGPVYAVEALLNKFSLTLKEIDRIELNEAFAAQALACIRIGKWPLGKINVSGGAIAYGHPFGATGSILVTRIMNELKRGKKLIYGIVTMCVGGGQGVAMLIRKV